MAARPITFDGCSKNALPQHSDGLQYVFTLLPSMHAGINFDSNPKRGVMLAAQPATLFQTAAGLLKQSEGVSKGSEGRPSMEAIDFTVQAGLAYLHSAALMKGRPPAHGVNATTR